MKLRTLHLGFPMGRSPSPAFPGRLPVTSHNFRCVVGARGSTLYLRQGVGGSAEKRAADTGRSRRAGLVASRGGIRGMRPPAEAQTHAARAAGLVSAPRPAGCFGALEFFWSPTPKASRA